MTNFLKAREENRLGGINIPVLGNPDQSIYREIEPVYSYEAGGLKFIIGFSPKFKPIDIYDEIPLYSTNGKRQKSGRIKITFMEDNHPDRVSMWYRCMHLAGQKFKRIKFKDNGKQIS